MTTRNLVRQRFILPMAVFLVTLGVILLSSALLFTWLYLHRKDQAMYYILRPYFYDGLPVACFLFLLTSIGFAICVQPFSRIPEAFRAKRKGFTLVEMIVVLAIMLILAYLGTAFLPRFLDNQMQTRAVDQLTQWLLTAKQRAKRDGAPTGLRILFDPTTLQATRMQYVQQPEPYTTGVCLGVEPNGNDGVRFLAGSVDFQGAGAQPGQVDKNFGELSPVLIGDYLEVNGGGQVHAITGVFSNSLTLSFDQFLLPPGAYSYRIIRQPRIMSGEDVLTLPRDMIVDNSLSNPSDPLSSWSRNIPVRSVVGGGGRLTLHEIVFSPSGAIIGQNTPSGKIILWVRNATKPATDPGAVTLISIQIRTGFIAAHPISLSGNYYQFTEDGRPSGL